jgi:hypothetical protein
VRKHVRGVKAADKALLYTIADATPFGQAGVTMFQRELSEQADLPDRSVRDGLARLRAAGLIETTGKGGHVRGRGIACTYRLLVPAEIEDEKAAGDAGLPFRSRRAPPPSDENRRETPGERGGSRLQERGESRRQEKNILKPLEESGGTAREVEAAVEAWNALADRAGLSKAQRLTDPRKRAIRARLKELGGLEGWAMLMEKVEASAFLTGQVPGRDGREPFRATLDWIIKPQNTTRIMEDSYGQASRNHDPDTGAGPGAGTGLVGAVKRRRLRAV